MAEKKYTFHSGMSTLVTTKEPLKYSCVGKITLERKVNYAGTRPSVTPKPSVTGG